jgi:hypothetical protein
VSYRSRALLRACLTSLRDHPAARPTSIHVVDNDSRDGTVETVRSEFPDVRVTETGRNAGFAAATNAGIRAGEHEYVLALNPDTRVTAGALDALLALMDERPDVGVCGCRLLRDDGTPDHAAKRSFPTIVGALGHFGGLARGDGALAQYRAPNVERGPVDAVNGAFMLMRRAALEEVGLFDEGYWMYMEDLDLCYRLAQAGWVTWYEPSVTVWHVKHGTSGERRSFRLDRAFHYGMFRFYRAHYAGDRSVFVNAAVYAGIAAKLAISRVRSLV